MDFLRTIEQEVIRYNGVLKTDLTQWLDELEVPYKKSASKLQLYNALRDYGIELTQFYERFKHKAFGVHPSRYTERFGLTKHQRKKMEQRGILKIMYYESATISSNYVDVPYYNLEQFYLFTDTGIERWKEENIRGYKIKKESAQND